MTALSRVRVLLGVPLVVIMVACSSGASPTAVPTTSVGATPAATAAQTAAPTTAPTAVPTAAPTASSGIGGPGDYTPGAVSFRVVNARSTPVDVYVRTQGLVQAYRITLGLAPGQATDYVAPPDPGTLVVITAGSGNPTCVATCPHILGTWSTTAGVSDQHTVIVSDGDAADLWEHPKAADIGQFANAIPPADATKATFYAIGGPLSGAEFGLRLAYAGATGCQDDATKSALLIGGTSILPFVHTRDSVQVTIHDNTDRDCSAAPVGGPFAVTGGVGTRTYLILTGSKGSMAAIVLPIK